LYFHVKPSLNSFNNYSTSNTLHVSNYALIFTIYGFALIPKLSFINCWFSINIHPTIYNFRALIFARVSSTTVLLDDVCNTYPNTPYPPKQLLTHICCQVSSSMCFVLQIHVVKY
jgi:hypothetical protein